MKREIVRILLVLIVAIISASSGSAQDKKDTLYRHNKTLNSISLPKNMKWYNTNREFKIDGIFNKIVVIHVWEPGSIFHDESILRANEIQRERRDVVIMTILNSSKKEYGPEMVADIVKAYGINHPVAVANDFTSLKLITNEFPVMVMTLNQGERMAEYAGKSCGNQVQEILEKMTQLGGGELLNITDIKTQINLPAVATTGVFLQPNTLEASDKEQRFYIADALHNRVIMMDVSGSVSETIGSGVQGYRDGTFGNCQLNYPTGVAIDNENRQLYISEPLNHTVRRVDLKTGEVKTILGNGVQAAGLVTMIDSTNSSISYPTDITFFNGTLLITMSGWNQIWEYSPTTKQAKVKIGSGLKTTFDGSFQEASFDVPQRITYDGNGNCYVFDAGSQSLRFISDGKVTTIVDAQTPMPSSTFGIPIVGDFTCSGLKLYVSDSDRNRILVLEDDKWKVLSGSNEAGDVDGKGKKARFDCPGGIDMSNGQLLVVDGFNNAVKEVRFKKGKSKKLELKNLEALFLNYEAYTEGDRVYLPAVQIGEGVNNIYIQFDFKGKYSIYSDGRNEVVLESNNFNRIISGSPSRGFVEVEVEQVESNQYIDLQLYLTVKEKATGIVWFRPVLLVVPFEYEEGAKKEHDIKWIPFN